MGTDESSPQLDQVISPLTLYNINLPAPSWITITVPPWIPSSHHLLQTPPSIFPYSHSASAFVLSISLQIPAYAFPTLKSLKLPSTIYTPSFRDSTPTLKSWFAPWRWQFPIRGHILQKTSFSPFCPSWLLAKGSFSGLDSLNVVERPSWVVLPWQQIDNPSNGSNSLIVGFPLPICPPGSPTPWFVPLPVPLFIPTSWHTNWHYSKLFLFLQSQPADSPIPPPANQDGWAKITNFFKTSYYSSSSLYIWISTILCLYDSARQTEQIIFRSSSSNPWRNRKWFLGFGPGSACYALLLEKGRCLGETPPICILCLCDLC